jgi:hypothetical protein
MPKVKIKKKSIHDKFYTHPSVAKECIDRMQQYIDFEKTTLIEPSAGSGSFSNQVNCLSYDILPESPSIKKQNFLLLKKKFDRDVCIFGNPPFGERNRLTNAFIKKATSLDRCKFVAFILPASFQKRSMQKVFGIDWKLISVDTIPKNSFILDGNPYHVNAIFQIWERDSLRDDLREKEINLTTSDFEFVKKESADWFVFGAAPKKIIDPLLVKDNNRGYYIKSKIDKNLLCDKLQAISWKSYASSSVSGGVAWFTKEEIVKIYQLNWSLT